MKKLILLAVLPSIVGCAGIGHLDAMNDIGLGQVSHGIRTAEKTQTVLGVSQQRSYLNTPSINRGYGEIENFQANDIPTTVRNVQEILRYLQ